MPQKLLMIMSLIAFGIVKSYALPSDATKPIRLTADKATFSERNGITTYSGNVVITQGTLKITSDMLSVNLSDNRNITLIQATGRPATFQQVISSSKGVAEGQAKQIEYNTVTGIVSLTGNASLTQAGASFSGHTIRYSLNLGDVEAGSGGGQRVELIFPPASNANHQAVRP